jgi:hypothetical protein
MFHGAKKVSGKTCREEWTAFCVQCSIYFHSYEKALWQWKNLSGDFDGFVCFCTLPEHEKVIFGITFAYIYMSVYVCIYVCIFHFCRNRLYRSDGFHCCTILAISSGLPCNNRFRFQGNIVKVNYIWRRIRHIFAQIFPVSRAVFDQIKGENRYYRVLTMVYNTQRYWIFGRWTKSENLAKGENVYIFIPLLEKC